MSATTLELPSGPAASAQWAAVAFVAEPAVASGERSPLRGAWPPDNPRI
jgi:hypothetical protein